MGREKKSVVLITLSGIDKPGITAAITGILAMNQVQILDVSQAVIHNLLSLSIIFETSPEGQADKAAIKDLLFKANELKLKLKFQVLDEPQKAPAGRFHYAVTLIGEPVSAKSLHEVAQALARHAINIDVIKRLSEECFNCVEMGASAQSRIDQATVKKDLLEIAKVQGVDIAFQAEGLYRRSKRLVVLDMDSTLIQAEVIDELAREKGVYDEVAAITHQAMNGKMNFDESLRLRVEKLKGLTADQLEQVFKRIQLTPGAEELIHVLKKLGYKIAVISGGFTFVADRLKERLGLDFAYANVLDVKEGQVTGKVLPPIVNAERKADLLDVIAQQERIELDQVIAIGDGANDLLMLEKAGLGIAFNAKPSVREKADLALSQKNLRSILYLLGLSGRDLLEAGIEQKGGPRLFACYK